MNALTMTLAATEKREEAKDKIAVLQRQEATTYRRPLPTFGSDKHWRQSIVEWMYDIVDSAGMQRDVVAVASYYLDATPVSTREEYQLCAMTALQLAMKLYCSSSMSWSSLVRLSRGTFNEDDICDMESRILESLKWRVHPPTANCFLREFLQLLPESVDTNSLYRLEQISRFVTEFASCLNIFCQYQPSHLAFAGMCVAMQRMEVGMVTDIHECMEANTGINFDDIATLWAELQRSLAHNVSLHELQVSMATLCSPVHKSTASPVAIKPVLQFSRSPRQVSC
jgi:hypothetical protein